MEVEAVTHVLRWIASKGGSRLTRAIFLTDSMSSLQKNEKWNGKLRLACVNGTPTFENSRGCTALVIPECKEMTEQID